MEIKTISYVGYKDTAIDLETIDCFYEGMTDNSIEDELISIKDVREHLNSFIEDAKEDMANTSDDLPWSKEDQEWLTSLIILERRFTEVEEAGATHIQF